MNTLRFARLERDGRSLFVELEGGAAHVLDGAPWAGGVRTGERIDGVDDQARGAGVRRLVPVTPTKILCIGRNYKAHAKELGNEVPAEPLLFWKPLSSLLAPDGVVELPPERISNRVDHEAEIAIVLGRRLRRATREEAARAVFGFTLSLDVTARDLQKKDGQWTRAKGMDTFCPTGPVIVTGLDPQAIQHRLLVNDQVRQDGNTRDMIFPVDELLAYMSETITLEPGDLVLTGTPEGVGPLAHGDRLAHEAPSIGVLSVTVSAAP